MAILLKTASVRVSSIQIIQVRVQNKGKSVWKNRYDGDVSPLRPRNSSLCHPRSPDRLLIASRLLSLVSAAINGIQPRCCRRSEFIAKLGYGLDHSAIPVRFLAHCVHYDSYHD